MTAWIVLAAYLAGVALTWRTFTISLLMDLEEVGTLNDDDRAVAAAFGFGAALIWPFALPARAVWRAVKRADMGRLLQTPREREAAQRAELEALRKLAREHNLPMPGGDA